jgi:hypothetical protein
MRDDAGVAGERDRADQVVGAEDGRERGEPLARGVRRGALDARRYVDRRDDARPRRRTDALHRRSREHDDRASPAARARSTPATGARRARKSGTARSAQSAAGVASRSVTPASATRATRREQHGGGEIRATIRARGARP